MDKGVLVEGNSSSVPKLFVGVPEAPFGKGVDFGKLVAIVDRMGFANRRKYLGEECLS